jgi:sulfopyruvate decarboxylase TPP-binding subunit
MMTQKDFTLVQVCREGEALPIAAGLVLGGKKPLVLHQSTGIFESGDSIRLVASELRLPILMLIGYRSWKPTPPMTDSAAIFIEPILRAWGIKYYLLRSDDDIDIISTADMEAQKTRKPVVILIARELQL